MPHINIVLCCQESFQRWGRDNLVEEEEVVRRRMLQKVRLVARIFLPFEFMAIDMLNKTLGNI